MASTNRINDTDEFIMAALKNDIHKFTNVSQSMQAVYEEAEAPISIDDIFEESKISVTDYIEKPEASFMIDDSIICTLGNFMTVSGKAKSKKTTFLCLLIAASLSRKLYGRFSSPLPEDKKRIIFIDTEQGKWHVQGVIKKVYSLIGKSYKESIEHFNVFSLRKYDTTQRLNLIEYIINKYDDIGIIYLDGVRDIVFSINDEKEATETATRLLRWTEERGISIVCVLHQNKGDTNVRGHLGTELVNKSETVISIEKDKQDEQRSIVQADYARNIDFTPFAFKYNDSGLPEIDHNWSPVQKDRKATKSPIDCPVETQIKILNDVKKHLTDKGKYNALKEQMTLAIAKNHQSVSERYVREYITYFINDDKIKKHGADRSRDAYYTIEL